MSSGYLRNSTLEGGGSLEECIFWDSPKRIFIANEETPTRSGFLQSSPVLQRGPGKHDISCLININGTNFASFKGGFLKCWMIKFDVESLTGKTFQNKWRFL